ncbi:MAG TPA: diguanylate cyclase [Bdellovibrionales bacterium]|nr:MAG: hypothetical protein A2X97_12455 [Bdellovibrionales bacterium GWA1_52_35]HAR43682.1 diguanylate cyclase [Bdellovibrionales bacterium]HCM41659.1 diguanylate cyclase [Bdellovibrionales bacterium]
MKICIPTNDNQGVESNISGHFGSAPYFTIVDTESLDCKAIVNTNQHHAHGMCQPLAVLSNEIFDGIVVGGIGAGALNRLQSANVKVFKTQHRTIRETVEAYKSNALPEVVPHMACSGHGHHDGRDPGLGHGHGRKGRR